MPGAIHYQSIVAPVHDVGPGGGGGGPPGGGGGGGGPGSGGGGGGGGGGPGGNPPGGGGGGPGGGGAPGTGGSGGGGRGRNKRGMVNGLFANQLAARIAAQQMPQTFYPALHAFIDIDPTILEMALPNIPFLVALLPVKLDLKIPVRRVVRYDVESHETTFTFEDVEDA